MRYTTRIIVPPRVRRSGAPGSAGTGPRPQVIGVRKSLGLGDPFGYAAPGHLAVASAHPEFAPFFAQAAPDQLAASGRTLADVLATAARAVGAARFRQPWGADADGLQTPQDVDAASAAGFTYFTIDLSGHVRDEANNLSPAELAATVDQMVADGELPEDWIAPYLDREVAMADGEPLKLTLEPLRRAAVRLGRAIQHGARMYETISRANRDRQCEIEISLGVAAPTGTVAHLYAGLELEARGVRLTSLAMRPEWHDPAAFEANLRKHVAIASFCGPYKLSFRAEHYPAPLLSVLGRACGDLLHCKTSAESFVAAMRLVWQVDPDRLRQIAEAAGIALPEALDLEAAEPSQSAYVGQLAAACMGQEAIGELLERHTDMYQELLVARFERLIADLNAG